MTNRNGHTVYKSKRKQLSTLNESHEGSLNQSSEGLCSNYCLGTVPLKLHQKQGKQINIKITKAGQKQVIIKQRGCLAPNSTFRGRKFEDKDQTLRLKHQHTSSLEKSEKVDEETIVDNELNEVPQSPNSGLDQKIRN